MFGVLSNPGTSGASRVIVMKKRFLFLTIISAFVSVAQAQATGNETRDRQVAPQEPNAQVRHYSGQGDAVNPGASRVANASANGTQRYAQAEAVAYQGKQQAYEQERAQAAQIEESAPAPQQVRNREKELNASYASARKKHSKVVSEVTVERKQLLKEFDAEAKVLNTKIAEAKRARDAKLEELDRAEVKLKATYAQPLNSLKQIMEDNSQIGDGLDKLRGEGEAELKTMLESISDERKAANAIYANLVDASTFEQQLLEDSKLEKEAALNEKLEESKSNFDERKKEHFRALAREKKHQVD